MNVFRSFLFIFIVSIYSLSAFADDGYENFEASVYTRVSEVIKMKDPEWLKKTFKQMDQHLGIGKIYLETHRDMVMIEEDALEPIILFFEDRGKAAAEM